MSYILDSLKKSEQQRKLTEQPGLYSEPLGMASRRSTERKIWPYLIVLVLLLNAGLIGWYLVTAREPVQSEIVQPVIRPVPPTVAQSLEPSRDKVLTPVSPALPRVESPVEESVVTDSHRDVPPPVAVTETLPAGKPPIEALTEPVLPAATERTTTEPQPVPIDRLPVSVQQQLPPLVLSLHYFSGSGSNSMIRLDGVILRVGDRVEDGLSVAQILAGGVVLDFRGRRIWLDRPQG